MSFDNILYMFYNISGDYMLNNRNYEYNKKLPTGDGYINGQAKCFVSKMKYGFFTMAYNGCGIIALYNLMYRKKKRISPADIAREIYPYSAICFGLLGNRMTTLKRFFAAHKMEYTLLKTHEDLINSFEIYDCFILGLWNDDKNPFKGKHFVFVRNINGKAIIYNYSSNMTKPKVFGNISEYLVKRRLTVAYCFK